MDRTGDDRRHGPYRLSFPARTAAGAPWTALNHRFCEMCAVIPMLIARTSYVIRLAPESSVVNRPYRAVPRTV